MIREFSTIRPPIVALILSPTASIIPISTIRAILATLIGLPASEAKRCRDTPSFSLSAIIQSQARRAAAFYRGEKEAYVPYASSW